MSETRDEVINQLHRSIEGQKPSKRNVLTRRLSEKLEDPEEGYRVKKNKPVSYKRLSEYQRRGFQFSVDPETTKKFGQLIQVKNRYEAKVTEIEVFPQKRKDGDNFYPEVRFRIDINGKELLAFFSPKSSNGVLHQKTRTFPSLEEFHSQDRSDETFVFFDEDMLLKKVAFQVFALENPKLIDEIRLRAQG